MCIIPKLFKVYMLECLSCKNLHYCDDLSVTKRINNTKHLFMINISLLPVNQKNPSDLYKT